MNKRTVLEDVLLLEAFDRKTVPGSEIMLLQGIFQKGDEPNANKRIYPMKYLMREVERLDPACRSRSLIGELDHPFFPDEAEAAVVHAEKASHVITKLWPEGNLVYGEMEVIDTPSGLILQEFINRNLTIGVSSRSLGSVKETINNFFMVDEDLRIITWDSVVGPSVVESNVKRVKALREWKMLKEHTLNQIHNDPKVNELDPEAVRDYIKKTFEALNVPKNLKK